MVNAIPADVVRFGEDREGEGVVRYQRARFNDVRVVD